MSNAEQWSVIIGFVLPLILAVIQQEGWKTSTRALVAFVACIIAALGTTYFAGTLTATGDHLKDLVDNIVVVLTIAIATYESFWKKTGVAPAIEKATNVRRTGKVAPA